MDVSPDLHLISVPSLAVPLKATKYASQPVPSLREFGQIWLAWDIVSTYMIPVEEQLSKPINLRNCCIFYLGHIPAFFDIHLTRATGDVPTTPSHYQKMFERGIDPDVENPEHCHAHSEVPAEWPPLEDILAYQGRVRDRVTALYKDADFGRDRKIGRALWLGFEHEGTVYIFNTALHGNKANHKLQSCIWRPCYTCFSRAIEPCPPQDTGQTSRHLQYRLRRTPFRTNGLNYLPVELLWE